MHGSNNIYIFFYIYVFLLVLVFINKRTQLFIYFLLLCYLNLYQKAWGKRRGWDRLSAAWGKRAPPQAAGSDFSIEPQPESDEAFYAMDKRPAEWSSLKGNKQKYTFSFAFTFGEKKYSFIIPPNKSSIFFLGLCVF